MDLSLYVRVGRFDLPEPTRTQAPANNVLAQEASGVTYDWDTDTLFIVGDGGRSVTQVSKTGQLIDTMTLALGSSPQGTEFYDTEGITYIGNGKFVMTEERDRQVVQFSYKAGTTLARADTQTVDLGTSAGNMGIEGLSYDPLTGGFILVKEKSPIGVFQTTIDFATGKASNGSATTENSVNLFNPNLLNVADLADVFALSNLPALQGKADQDHLLLLSQESATILEVDRAGNIISSRALVSDPGNPLDIASQQPEGITMDRNGNIYVVAENGGGDFDHPQLWVFAPSAVPNQAPTAIALANAVTSIAENTSTGVRLRVGDIVITDDGIGTNKLSLSGADAASFEVDNTGLYIKAGTKLDFETKTSYSVTVNVDDSSIGATPDASKAFTLAVADVVNESAVGGLTISEVAPWSSGSPVGADWFEVTNNGSGAIDITGWKMDDSSATFGLGAPLSGVSSIAAGESVIFMETTDLAASKLAFINTWFGGKAPTGLQFGSYSAGGVGLSTSGDAVNLYDAGGTLKASVSFGVSASGPFTTFDNSVGLNKAEISKQSVVGSQGAFAAAGDATEIGSPGSVGKLFISEVAPWSSGNSPVGADWFEVTNGTGQAIDISGWKVDDSSESPIAAVALNGITTIGAGESVIFFETVDLTSTRQSFIETWFGGKAPTGLQFGNYSGTGIGLSTDGDAVNLYDTNNVVRASVSFGKSPTGTFTTFDNSAGLDKAAITTASSVGVHSAFAAVAHLQEIGSPGTTGKLFISEVAPWSSGSSPIKADWFEVTNAGTSTVDITGWKVDDDSASFGSAIALNGITAIGAGELVIFFESSDLAATGQSFIDTWFGGKAPTGLQFGNYSGAGIGLGTGGDAVNLYDSSGALKANVSFGASPTGTFTTFDNAAGLDGVTIKTASAVGVNGGFVASADAKEIGSPGTIVAATPINTAPIAVADVATVDTNKSVTISVLTNDGDANGDKLSVSAVSGGLHGTTTFNADYSGVIYTPTAGFVGKDSFTYIANDGKGGSAEATVTVTVTGTPFNPVNVAITEVAPWSSGNSPIAADWFEVTNKGAAAVDITGWKVDDDSASFASALALNGIASIGAGESVIFIETSNLAAAQQSFINLWFGGKAPAGLHFGSYSGAGIGLGAGGDQVNLYDASGALKANVSFGASPANAPFTTFDNAAGLNGVTISTASAVGVKGGFAASADSMEIGSPGTIVTAPAPNTAPVAAADTATVEANKSITISVLANDSDPNGDKLTVTSVSGGLHGTTTFNADYSGVIYTPTAGFVGKDSFTYIANDGKGGIAEATVNVTTALAPGSLAITEVAPWSSGNSPVAADWFEVTNRTATAVDITGWKVDDDSASFASALALNGITSIGAGESVIFIETSNLAAAQQSFINTWFGSKAPAGLHFGSYSGAGIGLGAGGDQVNLYDAGGSLKANVSFGASPTSIFTTFDNAAGLNGVAINAASAVGVNGGFVAFADPLEIGSPGLISSLIVVIG